jgi:hypothetical protein
LIGVREFLQQGWAISRFVKTAGFAAALLSASALAILAEPALAKKAPQVRKQPPIVGYRLSGDVRDACVQRSFSISVGNPAYPNRLAAWPAPCGR